MDAISEPTIVSFLQLILALSLGILLGTERSFAGKNAGMRTYALISIGSCMLVVVSNLVTAQYVGVMNFDPMRLAAGIVTGIGLLCAGTIIFHESKVDGLTTAAGLWIACGVGIAVGYGAYLIAVFVTFLTIFTFTILWLFEQKVVHRLSRKAPHNNPPNHQ